ncbi:glycosyltransferase family 4 protein [Halobacteriaceae archaeon SHR40]|uniref:glycosyltransferase family 4 protein n=1 Tax=Halovenus amylolytica TaxID=2500550 RepID=UPI000FE2A4BE
MGETQSEVLVVSQNYPPDQGGNASRISDTCTHLANKGWRVTVLAPPPAFPHGEFDRNWTRKETHTEGNVTVHRLWAWQPTDTDPSFVSRLAYYLIFPLHALVWLLFNARDYDAMITSSPPIFTGTVGIVWRLLGRKPWVVDVRDLWIDASIGLGFLAEGGLLERASRAYEGFMLRLADRVTVTTTVLGERLSDQYGLDPGKIVHLPNGVDTGVYEPTDSDADPEIVYTGTVGYAQALEPCVRAMSEIEHPDATLKIVGDGDIRTDLEQIVDEENLHDRVIFTGLVPRDEIPGILDEAAVGIAPLEQDETFEYAVPTKAYEYMSAELPVVATGVGEIESLIDDSGGGVFVDTDPEKLAAAFDSLLADAEKRATFGEAGRTHVVEHYDREVVAQELNDVLRDVTTP